MEHRTGQLPTIEWAISEYPVAYPCAVALMRERAAAIAGHGHPELIWLLEHPPLYVAGTSARPEELLEPDLFPVFSSGRGGRYTYHGPGQRIAYVMLNLNRRGNDIRAFIASMENWVIDALGAFSITGEQRPGRPGIWVRNGSSGGEDKIAALGFRVSRGVSLHGIAINVEPDLAHYRGIVPCGIRSHGITSLVRCGCPVSMPEVDMALRCSFERLFAPTRQVEAPCFTTHTTAPA